MMMIQKSFGRLLSSILGILLVLAFTACTGTEVGNGLKPKDDNDPDKAQKQANDMGPTADKPGAGEVSNSQNSALAPLEIPLLRNLLIQNCGSPLYNAHQADLILSRVLDATVTKEKIYEATVAAGAWNLSDGALNLTLSPSGLWDFKGETFIKDGERLTDTFTCSEVTRGALAPIEKSSRYRSVFSMTMTRIADRKEFKIEWTATQESASAPLKAEYQLEQLVVTGVSGQSTIFAIYPVE